MTGPWIAGTFVNPKGMTKKVTASAAGGVVGGVVGNVAAGLATGPAYQGAPEVPDFGRAAYVAASADEIAIVKTRSGMLKMKVGEEVLARVPRSELASVDLDEGRLLSHLKVELTNGVVWEFDVPKANETSAHGLGRHRHRESKQQASNSDANAPDGAVWRVDGAYRRQLATDRPRRGRTHFLTQPKLTFASRSNNVLGPSARRRRARATGCRCRRPA